MNDFSDALSPFEGQDIRCLIDDQAERRGEHPFLIWEPFVGAGASWSYRAFRTALQRFAAGLTARGVAPGDRVLVHMTNSPEMLIAWLGCAYAGAVAVTTNAKSVRDELAWIAQHCGVFGAVTQPKFAAVVRAALPPGCWIAATDGDGESEMPRPQGFEPFAGIDGDPDTLPSRAHDPMAPFGIQYTSGTTARPKAVLWTHANALWGGQVCATHEDLGPDDVHLVHLPLFHTNAQVYSVLASLSVGATIVLQPRFSASRFWDVSSRHGCTWSSMVPFCVHALTQQPVPESHSYRFWGNAVCEPRADALFRVRTIGWWGMTETVAHGVVGSPHRSNQTMAMGRPSPFYQVAVRDADGRPVGIGQTGDLYLGGRRGVSLFAEYFRDPEATAAAFTPDGMLRTGDRVTRGADGFLFFSDRAKDMLKVGGENVATLEIELLIASLPGVREVAVVGKPDPLLNEVPVAFVLADESDALRAEIEALCARALAEFKRPREIRFVDSLPRATLEKIAKPPLRQLLLDEAKRLEPQTAAT